MKTVIGWHMSTKAYPLSYINFSTAVMAFILLQWFLFVNYLIKRMAVTASIPPSTGNMIGICSSDGAKGFHKAGRISCSGFRGSADSSFWFDN